jgi:hypothetical protein
VKIWLASGARTIAAVFYKPLPTSPNVLLLSEDAICFIDDKPTLMGLLLMLPSILASVVKSAILSTLMFVVDVLHALFTIFICGTAAWLISLVTQPGFVHEAEPEDIDEGSVSLKCRSYPIDLTWVHPSQLSRYMTTVDPNEPPVTFEPAEFYGVPEVFILLFHPLI